MHVGIELGVARVDMGRDGELRRESGEREHIGS